MNDLTSRVTKLRRAVERSKVRVLFIGSILFLLMNLYAYPVAGQALPPLPTTATISADQGLFLPVAERTVANTLATRAHAQGAPQVVERERVVTVNFAHLVRNNHPSTQGAALIVLAEAAVARPKGARPSTRIFHHPAPWQQDFVVLV